jgi:hypothetical protein
MHELNIHKYISQSQEDEGVRACEILLNVKNRGCQTNKNRLETISSSLFITIAASGYTKR